MQQNKELLYFTEGMKAGVRQCLSNKVELGYTCWWWTFYCPGLDSVPSGLSNDIVAEVEKGIPGSKAELALVNFKTKGEVIPIGVLASSSDGIEENISKIKRIVRQCIGNTEDFVYDPPFVIDWSTDEWV